MDLEKIKAQIAVIKDKVFDNIDKHFNEYYIDDILDSKEFDLINDPINDFDWYLYWTDIKEDLIGIFNQFFQKQHLSPTEHEILCECVSLKRELDKKIGAIPNFKEYETIDLLNYFEPPKIPPLALNVHISIKTIHNLHSYLLTHKYISDIEYQSFENHFNENDFSQIPIKWNKDAIKFVAFINVLYKSQVFDIQGDYKDKKWELVKLHFSKSDGSHFNTNVLSSRASQINYLRYYEQFKEELARQIVRT